MNGLELLTEIKSIDSTLKENPDCDPLEIGILLIEACEHLRNVSGMAYLSQEFRSAVDIYARLREEVLDSVDDNELRQKLLVVRY